MQIKLAAFLGRMSLNASAVQGNAWTAVEVADTRVKATSVSFMLELH